MRALQNPGSLESWCGEGAVNQRGGGVRGKNTQEREHVSFTTEAFDAVALPLHVLLSKDTHS